jgi:hypothetical protein
LAVLAVGAVPFVAAAIAVAPRPETLGDGAPAAAGFSVADVGLFLLLFFVFFLDMVIHLDVGWRCLPFTPAPASRDDKSLW